MVVYDIPRKILLEILALFRICKIILIDIIVKLLNHSSTQNLLYFKNIHYEPNKSLEISRGH